MFLGRTSSAISGSGNTKSIFKMLVWNFCSYILFLKSARKYTSMVLKRNTRNSAYPWNAGYFSLDGCRFKKVYWRHLDKYFLELYLHLIHLLLHINWEWNIKYFVVSWKLFVIGRSDTKFKKKVRLFAVEIIQIIKFSFNYCNANRGFTCKVNVLDKKRTILPKRNSSLVSKRGKTIAVRGQYFDWQVFIHFITVINTWRVK